MSGFGGFGGFGGFASGTPAPQRGRRGPPRGRGGGPFGTRPAATPAQPSAPTATLTSSTTSFSTAPGVTASTTNFQTVSHPLNQTSSQTPVNASNQSTAQVAPTTPMTPTPNPAPVATDPVFGTAAGAMKRFVPPEKKAMLKIWMECKSRFPLSSSSHGTELVTVLVGEGDNQRSCVVHKFLLCAASDYFSAALIGSFKEAHNNNLTLKDQCAMAFEVLYQFIYTGLIQPAFFYTKIKILSDTLWLRTFKLADATMVQDLKQIAYKCLRDYFNSAIGVPPSQTFVDELFAYEYPQGGLQNFIVAHSAYWINNNATTDWKTWHKRMKKNMACGAAVGLQLTKMVSKTYEGSKIHPCDDEVFDPEVLYPEPAMTKSAAKGDGCSKNEDGASGKATTKAA